MGKELLTVKFLLAEYGEKNRSTVEIAKMTGTYPEQVRRALKKHHIPVRSRSTASRNFYDNGGQNARKGYKFTEEEKERASITAKEFWLSDDSTEARQKISKASCKYWKGVSKEEKRNIVERLHKACREASQEGSKAQLTIAAILTEKYDFMIQTGAMNIAGLGELEADIILPTEAIAIEVDGITHFKHVYSDNRYERAQEADKRKNEHFNKLGWSVIRVHLKCERFSRGSCLLVSEELNELIKSKNYENNGVTIVEMH